MRRPSSVILAAVVPVARRSPRPIAPRTMGFVTDSDTTRTPIDSPPSTPPPSAADPGATPTPPTPPSPATSSPNAPPPPAAPNWRPPPSDSGRNASLIVGAIILLIGLWFFATRTLGLDLPEIDWGSLWPVILIAVGAWIVLTAMRQRSR